MPNLEISAHDLETVQQILRRHIPDRVVLVFGSRAMHRAKPFSDLDLAVLGDEPLASHLLSALRDDFDDSDLPFKVDIVDWATTNPAFRKIIEQQGVLVQNLTSV